MTVYTKYGTPPDLHVSIPTSTLIETEGVSLNLNPMEIGDLNIKQEVEYYVNLARKDDRETSHLSWKSKFKTDYKNIYVYLKRIRKNFKEKHPDEKFNINGMAWYNKS